jgi:hypothetical protein
MSTHQHNVINISTQPPTTTHQHNPVIDISTYQHINTSTQHQQQHVNTPIIDISTHQQSSTHQHSHQQRHINAIQSSTYRHINTIINAVINTATNNNTPTQPIIDIIIDTPTQSSTHQHSHQQSSHRHINTPTRTHQFRDDPVVPQRRPEIHDQSSKLQKYCNWQAICARFARRSVCAVHCGVTF